MTGPASLGDERLRAFSNDQAKLLNLLLEEKFREREKIRPYPRSRHDSTVRSAASWAQQRLWFIDQLEGGTPAYHIAMGVRLKGILDEPALREALEAIVQRHEALRTVFVAMDEGPQQEIAPTGRFPLKVIDLRRGDDAEREAQVEKQKLEELHEKFDLRTGPLIRGRLLQLPDEEHVLLVTMHHIVSDGWSMGLFFREFAELYRACQEERKNPLEPLPIQYADYAQWQREWLQGEELNRQLAYWRAQLTGAAPQLVLPTDRARPPIQSYRGRSLRVVLDAMLSTDLKRLAQRHEMTLFMVLYAGWAILLSRLSGQDDVVIGIPVANRRRGQLEDLIGFFVNTLALRVGVRSDLPVGELLKQVKDVSLGAYDHQDVPFERVVEALAPERSLSRNPIFQVMFALQSTPNRELLIPGLTVTAEEGVDEPAMFDLLLSLEERGDQIVGYVNYAVDLFDGETVERWIECFTALLRAMTSNPHRQVGTLPIMSEAERCRVLDFFNETRAAYPREMLVHELFEAQVERTPEAVAIEHEGHMLTYAELNARANRLARAFVSCDAGPDTLVGICMERSPQMIIGLLGILKAGAAYLPLDPNYPAERLAHMIEDAAPKVVLSEEKLMSRLLSTPAELLLLDRTLEPLDEQLAENLPAAERGLRAEHLVYAIYTSGSTGKPKGTAMAHRSMINLIEWHRCAFPECVGVRVLQFAALSFDVAFQETFTTLCTGGTLVLVDEWVRRDARSLAELLAAERIARLFLPPLMLQSLAEASATGSAQPLGLRDVITAGEQLRISPQIRAFFARLPGARLHNHYGPTETHVVTALTLEGAPGTWPDLPLIGRPISNTHVYVLDPQRQPVPIGVTGELYIGGAGVARGYLHRPELTAERFLPDPLGIDPSSAVGRGRLYKTGDLGRWRADGTLEYLGRNDDQVKIRGFRVELGEIEVQLAKHPEVREVAVVAREEALGQKCLVAYLTAKEAAAPHGEGLRSHLAAVLPEHMIPSAFVMLDHLPCTPSGKLDRRALPAHDLSAYVTRPYEPPQGEIEQLLANIWQELLKIERVGRHDNFFQLGGHSLLATRVISHIGHLLDVDIPLRVMFELPTIEALSRRVNLELVADSPLEAS